MYKLGDFVKLSNYSAYPINLRVIAFSNGSFKGVDEKGIPYVVSLENENIKVGKLIGLEKIIAWFFIPRKQTGGAAIQFIE